MNDVSFMIESVTYDNKLTSSKKFRDHDQISEFKLKRDSKIFFVSFDNRYQRDRTGLANPAHLIPLPTLRLTRMARLYCHWFPKNPYLQNKEFENQLTYISAVNGFGWTLSLYEASIKNTIKINLEKNEYKMMTICN